MRITIIAILFFVLFPLQGMELDVVELKDGRTLEGTLKTGKRYQYYEMDLFYKGKKVATATLHENDIVKRSKKTVQEPKKEKAQTVPKRKPIVRDLRKEKLQKLEKLELAKQIELSKLRGEIRSITLSFQAEAQELQLALVDKVLPLDLSKEVTKENLAEVAEIQEAIDEYKKYTTYVSFNSNSRSSSLLARLRDKKLTLGRSLSQSSLIKKKFPREIVAIEDKVLYSLPEKQRVIEQHRRQTKKKLENLSSKDGR